jgi:PAS domain S-box-containing protein
VYGAGTAAEALEAVVRIRPHVVLLDVILPDGSGVDVCRRIKEDPQLADAQVILLSSHMTSPDRQSEGLEAGADGYLSRPVAARELRARVGAAVRNSARLESARGEEQRYRALVVQSPALLAAVSRDGTLEYLNPAAWRLLGHPLGGLIGRPAAGVLEPEDLPAVHAALADARSRALAQLVGIVRVRCRDGTSRRIELRASLISESPDDPIVVVGRDLTDTVRTPRDATFSELVAVLDSAAVGVLLFRENAVMYANPALCAVLGVAPEDVRSAPLRSIVDGFDPRATKHRFLRSDGEAVELLGGPAVPMVYEPIGTVWMLRIGVG